MPPPENRRAQVTLYALSIIFRMAGEYICIEYTLATTINDFVIIKLVKLTKL